MAEGSSRYIQFVKESVAGVPEVGGDFKRIDTTGGSGLANARTNITSNTIRSDRAIVTSRLGQNQPDLEIPFELNYANYDELLSGALGTEWAGGIVETVIASADNAGSTFTRATGSWAADGIKVGDYLYVSSTSNTGPFRVSVVTDLVLTVTAVDGTGAGLTDSSSESTVFAVGHYGETIDTGSETVAVDGTAQTITRTAGWVDLGVEVGDWLIFTGFSEAGNGNWMKVTTVTDTVLTFGEAVGLVTESLSSGDLEVVTSSGILYTVTDGTDLKTYTIEEGFTDVTEYHYIGGAKVSSFAMSIQPDSIVTATLSMQGQNYSGFSASSIEGSHADSVTNEVFDSYTGNLIIPGVADCIVTGVDFTMDNGLNRRYAIMQKDACSIGEGRVNVTGTLNAYFPNSTVADLFENETEFAMAIRVEDLDGNSYTFGWPRVKLTSDTRDISENDVTESAGFQALGGEAKTTMYIKRQPVVA